MANYRKREFVAGKWVDKKKIHELGIKEAKIVSETNPETSRYKDDDGNPQTQDVCKVQFVDLDEPVKLSLNQATINGLVDAFGESSKDWQGHPLSVETEKTRFGGKAGVSLYLIPAGYSKIDDEEGYARIVKDGVPGDEVEIHHVDDGRSGGTQPDDETPF